MKKLTIGLLLPVVLVGAVFTLTCFQGIDLADEWFWYSNAYVMSVAPDKASYSFGYYLSVLMSSLWGQVMGDSMISFRFLAVFSKLLIMVMSYFILRKIISAKSLFWGLTIGGFFTYGGVMTFYGNTCTALFYMGASVVAYLWIETGYSRHLFFFGFVLGSGAFARIANVTDFLFLIIIPFYRLVSRQFTVGLIVKDCSKALLGWLCGAGAVLGIIALSGCWDSFIEMLGTYATLAEASDSGHSFSDLVMYQLKYYFDAFYYSLPIVIVVAVSIVSAYATRKVSSRIALSVIIVAAIASAIITGRLMLLLCRFEVVSVFIVCFVLACFFERRSNVLTIWVLAMLCLAVSPLGSDVAGNSNKYCMPFYLPLVFNTIAPDGVMERFFCHVLKMGEKASENICKILFGLMLILGAGLLRQIWIDPIRDNSDRLSLTTCSSVKGLEHIRTTPERAKAIETIVAKVKENSEPDQPLLVFHSAPGLHALTGMLPYTCSTWSFMLTPKLFQADIIKAQGRFNGRLPLVVLPKWAVGCREWPQEHKAQMASDDTMRLARRQVFCKFLLENGYKAVFENEDFIIYKVH